MWQYTHRSETENCACARQPHDVPILFCPLENVCACVCSLWRQLNLDSLIFFYRFASASQKRAACAPYQTIEKFALTMILFETYYLIPKYLKLYRWNHREKWFDVNRSGLDASPIGHFHFGESTELNALKCNRKCSKTNKKNSTNNESVGCCMQATSMLNLKTDFDAQQERFDAVNGIFRWYVRRA